MCPMAQRAQMIRAVIKKPVVPVYMVTMSLVNSSLSFVCVISTGLVFTLIFQA